MGRILICGARGWTDKQLIADTLSEMQQLEDLSLKPTSVIQGGNGYLKGGRAVEDTPQLLEAVRGADALAAQVAQELGLDWKTFWAPWKDRGKGAGLIRNTQMLEEGRPHVVLAFHDDIRHSKGTRDMLRKAEKARQAGQLYLVKLITH